MNSGPTLQQGSTGNGVKRLQRLFVMMKTAPQEAIDGSFGPKTKAAVIDFQKSVALPADGIVGPNTWSKLPADPNTPLIKKGSTGTAVTGMQKALKNAGGPDPGPADGHFGPKTEAAVKAYQTDRGVPSDGIVGDRTWWVPAGAAGAALASLSGLTTV